MPQSWSQPSAAVVEPDEQLLLERLAGGDERALDAIIQTYWSCLIRFATALLGSVDAAEDVVQLTFVRIWQQRDRLEVRQSLRALLYRTTRNLAYNESQRHHVRLRLANRIRNGQPSPPTPLELVVGEELDRAARAALDGLPPRRREAFILCRFHDMSHREAAEVLGTSRHTVSNQVTAALRHLRNILRPYLES